jgi:TPR repeat protein
MYERGLGVERDGLEAVRRYCQLAESRYAPAEMLLGQRYANGQLERLEEDEYVHWIVAAAKEGDDRAVRDLGFMFARNQLATCGFNRAQSWILKAAEQGDSDAQYDLGVHSEQSGYSQNYAETFRWYSMAAEQGHGNAQHRLGLLYELGRGAVQDFTHAYMWANLAVSQATEDCEKAFIEARDRIAAKATPGQMAQGQRLASAWKPKKWRAPKTKPQV